MSLREGWHTGGVLRGRSTQGEELGSRSGFHSPLIPGPLRKVPLGSNMQMYHRLIVSLLLPKLSLPLAELACTLVPLSKDSFPVQGLPGFLHTLHSTQAWEMVIIPHWAWGNPKTPTFSLGFLSNGCVG